MASGSAHCGVLSGVCALPEGGGAAAVGGAAGLQPAEDPGPGVHLQEGPAEEHSGAAPCWTGGEDNIQDRNVPLLHCFRFPPLQAHGSPGAFWESEQESLLFVIEMKSEQVQEQSRKQQNMEALVNAAFAAAASWELGSAHWLLCLQVKKNLALEDQIAHVLQQNEDLKVRIDNCQTLIQYVSCGGPCWRPGVLHPGPVTTATYWPPASLHVFFLVLRQISREEQDLKVALERQTAMNQNLSQEKEQLMFKLRHRASYPSIHLPAMVPELAPR